jgi:hypothetical protein
VVSLDTNGCRKLYSIIVVTWISMGVSKKQIMYVTICYCQKVEH